MDKYELKSVAPWLVNFDPHAYGILKSGTPPKGKRFQVANLVFCALKVFFKGRPWQQLMLSDEGRPVCGRVSSFFFARKANVMGSPSGHAGSI